MLVFLERLQAFFKTVCIRRQIGHGLRTKLNVVGLHRQIWIRILCEGWRASEGIAAVIARRLCVRVQLGVQIHVLLQFDVLVLAIEVHSAHLGEGARLARLSRRLKSILNFSSISLSH